MAAGDAREVFSFSMAEGLQAVLKAYSPASRITSAHIFQFSLNNICFSEHPAWQDGRMSSLSAAL